MIEPPSSTFGIPALLHFFLGIHSASILDTHPARGMSWEALIIDQLISVFQQAVPASQAYFWRTSQGHKIDLLVDLGTKKIPFEIKLHSAPTAQDAGTLKQCMRDLNLSRGYLVHSGRQHYSLGDGVTAFSAELILSRPQALWR